MTARVDSTYGTSRSDISRTVPTGGLNVARDARQLALATQAQLASAEQLRILQQRQIAAAQKSAADESAKAAKQSKLLADQAAAQAKRAAAQAQQLAEAQQQAATQQQAAADQQAAAEQQQSNDQAAAAAQPPAPTNDTPTYTGTDPRSIARQMMQQKYGWGSDQFSCFNNIIEHESGWKVNATNPTSGAYGIPQALPGSKMASAGSDWRTNPTTQISWGLSYVKARYGTPCGALSFRQGHGYY